jgi:hypothetical protein
MIKQPEPSLSEPTLNDWGQEIADRQFVGGGLILIGLANMNTPSAPAILAGSRMEVNGTLYKAQINENIEGAPVNNARNFIYVAPGVESATAQYSTVVPTWDAAKGGWYDGNNRAVAVFCYGGGGYYGKRVITGSGNLDEIFPTYLGDETSGGTLAAEGAINAETKYVAEPGAYRMELKGGKGGNGGNGGSPSAPCPAGGEGADGEARTMTLLVSERKPLFLSVGGDGNAGGVSGGTDNGGGGGSTGGASYIRENVLILAAHGGSGGGGGGGRGSGSGGGGGGGGGFGSGGDGASGFGGPGFNGSDCGSGGANFNGGNGGGNGGDGSGSFDACGVPGSPGGGAGGGAGGGSLKFSYPDGFPIAFYNARQGGGGGGRGSGEGGAGGGGLEPISSGYCRLYRLF